MAQQASQDPLASCSPKTAEDSDEPRHIEINDKPPAPRRRLLCRPRVEATDDNDDYGPGIIPPRQQFEDDDDSIVAPRRFDQDEPFDPSSSPRSKRKQDATTIDISGDEDADTCPPRRYIAAPMRARDIKQKK